MEAVVQIADRFGGVGGDGAPFKRATQADRGATQGASQLRDRVPRVEERLNAGVGLGGVHLAPRREVFGAELNGQHPVRCFRSDSKRGGDRFPQHSTDRGLRGARDLDDLVESDTVSPEKFEVFAGRFGVDEGAPAARAKRGGAVAFGVAVGCAAGHAPAPVGHIGDPGAVPVGRPGMDAVAGIMTGIVELDPQRSVT
jgi:hypothetical protein